MLRGASRGHMQRGGLVKRGIFLAAAALLAMLILVPMAMGQGTTVFDGTGIAAGGGGGGIPSGTTVIPPQAGGGGGGIPSGGSPAALPPSGGSVLLPTAALLLGGGILSYAIL